MKTKTVERKENKLLGREEIMMELEYEGPTPKIDEMRNAVIAEFAFSPENFVIRENVPLAGTHKLILMVHYYKDKARMKEVEPEYILKRNKLVEEQKKEQEG